MRRKRVTADELSWIIFEKTRDALGVQKAVSVAIVPDGLDGWTSLFSKKLERTNPEAVALVHKLEKKLRSEYVLKS